MSTTPTSIEIAGRRIGAGAPAYLIAELSGNHKGSYERARDLVRAAKAAGADAVKLQTYTADTMTLPLGSPMFTVHGGLWDGRTLYDLYSEASTPWEWHPRLLAYAREIGIELFSTPFDETAVDFLEGIGVAAYKIASFEVTDLALIERVARTGKPLLVSTGMATKEEIGEAVETARAAGTTDIVLLRCTSAYPADPATIDLATIPDLGAAFGTIVGLSDHTLSTAVAVVAVTLGASVVEKHFTLRRVDGGPDAAFSLEPEEFATMVRDVRTAERAVGGIRYGPSDAERESLVFRRSLFVVRPVHAGEAFTDENIRAIRPGYGLAPRNLREVLGRRATRDIEPGTPLHWDLVSLRRRA